jgi:hemerythrin-like domain-containing protein
MDAFTLLGEDHDEILDLLARIVQVRPSATDATAAQLQRCKDLVSRLILVEAQHQALEKECFWPVVRNELPEGPRLASSARAREDTARHELARLDRTAPDAPEFERLLDAVVDDIRAHITYEQHSVWPKVRETLSPERLAQIGDRMTRSRSSTPPGFARKA